MTSLNLKEIIKLKEKLELSQLKSARMSKALLLVEGIIDDMNYEHIGEETRDSLREIVKTGLGY